MKKSIERKIFHSSVQGTSQLNQFDLLQRRRQKPPKSFASILGLIALSLASLNAMGSIPRASAKPELSRPPLPTRQDMAIGGVPYKHQIKSSDASQQSANPQIRQPVQSSRAF